MPELKSVNDVAEQTRLGSQNNLIVNAVENYPRIKQMFEKTRPDVGAINFPPNTPALIVGSGSSLDENLDKIRNWKGVIFATPQTFGALMSHGIVPNFVTAVDTSIDDVTPLRGEGNSFTTLITHPSIHPEMLDAWKGPIVFSLVNFDDECDVLFRAIYPYITFNVGAQGCVSNMQLIMAMHFRVNPVCLVGMDMQNSPKGQTAATRWKKVGNWRWEAVKPDMSGKPDEIPIVMQFYRLLLAVIWKGSGINLFRIGRGLDIIPEISMENAGAHNWPNPKPHHEIVKTVDAYTIPEGVYGDMENGRVIEFAERITQKPRNKAEEEAAKKWTKLPDGKWRRSI